eukprot:3206362-Amphidinium_carterae.1
MQKEACSDSDSNCAARGAGSDLGSLLERVLLEEVVEKVKVKKIYDYTCEVYDQQKMHFLLGFLSKSC